MLGRALLQALLLEGYWAALRRDPKVSPPSGLDADVVDTAARLAKLTAELQPRAATINTGRERVMRAATELAGRRNLTVPAPAPRWLTSGAASQQEEDRSTLPVRPMPDVFEIEARQPRLLQLLRLVAAVIAFALVTTVLVLVLRTEESQLALPIPLGTLTGMPSATPVVSAAATGTPDDATASATLSMAPIAEGIGTLTATIPVSADPFDVVFAAGSVWVSDIETGTVSRIDPVSNAVVATIAVGSPGAVATYLAATDADIWVVNEAVPEVVRIDPATNQVVSSFALPRFGSVAFKVRSLAVGHGSLWLTHSAVDGGVVRINPDTGAIQAEIAVATPQGLAVSDDAVWIANVEANTLTRIDPATNQVVATIQVGGAPVVVAVSADAVWVGNRSSGSVSRIDPLTNAVVATIPVNVEGSVTARIQIGALAFGTDALWVAAEKEPGLHRIDPTTNTVVAAAQIAATRLAVHADDLWIGSPGDGGVLRVTPKS